MSFKVKVTMTGFLGDTEKYPCHFKHRPGDEVIFDGEKFTGTMCSSVWPLAVPTIFEVHKAGPRWVPSAHYFPFWYAPISVDDDSLKKYDGLGFRNVLETPVEPQYHMANLAPANAFKWPPHAERTVSKGAFIMCGDLRTAATFKVEAIDLADRGYMLPYYRRQMVILHKVLAEPGVAADRILGLFSREENEGIYPALSQIMIQALNEELELMGYLEIKDQRARVTDRGEAKLAAFRDGLAEEEREALKL